MTVAELNTSFMDIRASRGFILNYPNALPTSNSIKSAIIQPLNNYDVLEQMIRNDEVLSTAFDTTVDVCTRTGWSIIPKRKKGTFQGEVDKATARLIELDFSQELDKIIYSMCYYGDGFLEKRRETGTKVSELHNLETTEMRIESTEHGDVTGYWQRPFLVRGQSSNNKGQGVFFKENAVIHFGMKFIGARVYSQTPLEPIARLWTAKFNGHGYIASAFQNLPPELLIHLKGANQNQKDEFMGSLQRKKQQPTIPIISYGNSESGVQVEKLGFDPGQNLLKVFEYLREAILMISRVPSTWVGMVNRDGSNRSNSESQVFSFETRIHKIQRKIEDRINKKLLPDLGFNNVMWKFNPTSLRDEKETLENVSALSAIGVKPVALVKYLRRHGITEVREEDIEKPDPMAMGGFGNQTATNLNAPSRKGMDKKVDTMTNKIDKTGTSQAGKAKRAEQKAKQR